MIDRHSPYLTIVFFACRRFDSARGFVIVNSIMPQIGQHQEVTRAMDFQSGNRRGWKRCRFRLVTLMLLVAVASIFFAWALHYRNRVAFAGDWYYPTPDEHRSGYWETLTIRQDGTFTKLERGRIGQDSYSGTYSVADNGVVTFHVTQKLYDPGHIPLAVETYAVDKSYRCRVAIDAHGNLIVVCLDPDFGAAGDVRIGYPWSCDLAWHWYSPLSHEKQSEAFMEQLNGP